MTNKTIQPPYEKRIAFLHKDMRNFALHDKDTKKDIMEQKLNQEEIESIVYVNMHYENLSKKQKITMNIPGSTLQKIKINAQKLGIPYQTFISSILHQYTTGQLNK